MKWALWIFYMAWPPQMEVNTTFSTYAECKRVEASIRESSRSISSVWCDVSTERDASP